MNNIDLISVIVPLYNKEQWIERCILSIIDQSYQNIEILIINDGSTDGSRNVLAKIDDQRIKIFDKQNGGVSSARNFGIEKAKGEYIAFIDADDEWKPKHISLLVKGFKQYKNAAMVSNKLEEKICNKETDTKERLTPNTSDIDYKYSVEDYLLSLSRDHFSLHIGSSMFKKSMLDTHVIRFYDHIRLGEDINFLIRASQLGECILCDYVGLIYYRDDENSAMSRDRKEVSLTPLYFYGIDQEKWSQRDREKITKFLYREYTKKAYQNRGLEWKNEELSTEIGGGVEIGKLSILIYLVIRFSPQFLFSLIKKIRV